MAGDTVPSLDDLFREESEQPGCRCYVGRLDPDTRSWLQRKIAEYDGRPIPWAALERALTRGGHKVPARAMREHYRQHE